MTGHFIVCGMGQSGFRIISLLLRLGEKVTVVALEVREEWRKVITARGGELIQGDARDIQLLIQAGLDTAQALIATTDNDLVNLEIALDTKKRAPNLPIVIRIFDQTLAQQLEVGFAIRRALSMSAIAAPMFAAAAMGETAICAFRLEEHLYVIRSLEVTPDSPLANRTVSELGERYHLAVLDHEHENEENDTAPLPETPILPGDRVTVLSAMTDWNLPPESGDSASRPRSSGRRALEPLINGFRPAFWSDFLRQMWHNTSLPLKTIFLALNLLILFSVGVFHIAMKLSVVDALYFVVTTVTTV